MHRLNIKGFSLPEVMITVIIIGVLAAIAIPNFIQARTTANTRACQSNEAMIDAAIQQWILEDSIGDGTSISGSQAQWEVFLPGGLPECPDTSAYDYGGNAVGGYTVDCNNDAH